MGNLQVEIEIGFDLFLMGLLFCHCGGGLHPANRWVGGAAFGRERQQRHSWPDSQKLARKLCRRDRDIRKLIHARLGNDAAIAHEQDAILAEARIFNFHYLATRSRSGLRRDFDDLKKGPQNTAGEFTRARNEAVGLMHRNHHRTEIIRLHHRFARLETLHSPRPPQDLEAPGKIIQVIALGRVDNANALEGNVQRFGGFLNLRPVSEQDGGAEPQRKKLPCRLQDARFGSLGKHNPFRMALQLLDDATNESHGASTSLRLTKMQGTMRTQRFRGSAALPQSGRGDCCTPK